MTTKTPQNPTKGWTPERRALTNELKDFAKKFSEIKEHPRPARPNPRTK